MIRHRHGNDSWNFLFPGIRIEAGGVGSFTIEKFTCCGTYFLFGNIEITGIAGFVGVPLDHISRGV